MRSPSSITGAIEIARRVDHRQPGRPDAERLQHRAIERHGRGRSFRVDQPARPGRRGDVQQSHRDGRRNRRGRGTAQYSLIHTEIRRQDPPVAFRQDTRRTALHELLEIRFVPPEHARQSGKALPGPVDQSL
ncbi:hypothetical protein [Sphingomonas aliaeris]|uniref:hypothetical protein n=1 Tax=Sphingomonas aliaeris TaxID=2759526 RepID=UPI001CED0F52|nr:hypothetical protein [Sphingomonas aliaeris]